MFKLFQHIEILLFQTNECGTTLLFSTSYSIYIYDIMRGYSYMYSYLHGMYYA